MVRKVDPSGHPVTGLFEKLNEMFRWLSGATKKNQIFPQNRGGSSSLVLQAACLTSRLQDKRRHIFRIAGD